MVLNVMVHQQTIILQLKPDWSPLPLPCLSSHQTFTCLPFSLCKEVLDLPRGTWPEVGRQAGNAWSPTQGSVCTILQQEQRTSFPSADGHRH